MNETIIPDSYQPLTEIRTNKRFSTFEGRRNGERVFIKYPVSDELKGRLVDEAAGLQAMRQLDPNESLYRVPSVIELTDTYIVTEWAEGKLMEEDFKVFNTEAIERHLEYLIRLYAFVDQAAASGVASVEATNTTIDKTLARLSSLNFESYVDEKLVQQIAEYIRTQTPHIETKATNGDLQPGNIFVSEGAPPTVVDCESYRDIWPRHYNIINFVFNYGAAYPGLQSALRVMLESYAEKAGVVLKDSTDTFNISAATRTLQMLEERLSGEGLSDDAKRYITNAIRNILEGHLFNE